MSSNETARIEREVEEKRRDVEAKVDALKQRLSPGQLIDEFGSYLRHSGGGDMARNFGAQVRDNPLPLALIGAGVAWLAFGEGRRRNAAHDYRGRYGSDGYGSDGYGRDEFGAVDTRPGQSAAGRVGTGGGLHGSTAGTATRTSTVSGQSASASDNGATNGNGMAKKASDAASRAGQSVSSAASSAGDTVKGAASSAGHAVSSGAASARDAASSAYDRTGRALGDAGQAVSEYGARARRSVVSSFYEEPLVIGALALAVGAAIGSMLPSTELEDRHLGPVRDKALDEAKGIAKEQYETARTAAGEAYDSAKDEAENQGLLKEDDQTLAEKVDKVARAGASAAKEEAKRKS